MHNPEATPDLAPCPFCGSGALFQQMEADEWREDENEGAQYVECIVCKCCTPLMFPCGEDVKPLLAEKWNRRVDRHILPAPVGKEVW